MFLLRVRGAFVCFLLRLRGGGGGALRQGVRSCFFPCGSETGVRRRVFSLAGANKDTVAMGFVRGAAMVDFHIQGRVEKKWFGLGLAVSVPDNEPVKNSGLAQLGSDRVGLAIKKTGLAWLGLVSEGVGGWGDPAIIRLRCTILAVFCLCLWSDGTVCTWEHMGASAATNTTGRQLRQIKIPWQWVSWAEQRWWTVIYMVALKRNGLGWAWQC